MPGTAFNGATIARSQLLRPFPQFGNVRTFDDDGTSRYHSAADQAREAVHARAIRCSAAYTWSQFTEQVFKLNVTDTSYEKRPSASDVPHRVAISGIWELPFGHGRRWASDAGRLADAFIGGWSVQAIGQLQSGRRSTSSATSTSTATRPS